MEKLEMIKNMAEKRISIWIRMHERLLAEKKSLEEMRAHRTPSDEKAAQGA